MIQGIIMKASVEFRRGSASCSRRLAYQDILYERGMWDKVASQVTYRFYKV
jgi:hypothetical protein